MERVGEVMTHNLVTTKSVVKSNVERGRQRTARGSLTDPSMVVAFAVVGLIGALLAIRGVIPLRSAATRAGAAAGAR
ncbi:MAG TPA: hypothetical protein VHM48_09080 [Candidatus Limnocylindrales bacterium]|nr:hypothetical protein [Candidatus Limnocylindrales bacterium]